MPPEALCAIGPASVNEGPNGSIDGLRHFNPRDVRRFCNREQSRVGQQLYPVPRAAIGGAAELRCRGPLWWACSVLLMHSESVDSSPNERARIPLSVV